VEVCGARPSNTIFYLALPTRTALKGRVLDPVANKYEKELVLNYWKYLPKEFKYIE
jgi:hypothetical protein